MRKTLIFGTGKSGISAAGLLKREGKPYFLFDEKEDLDKSRFPGEELLLGSLSDEIVIGLDMAVLSPGIPSFNENVKKLYALKVPVIGELGLGYTYEKGRVAGITGTNGKTTTTALCGHIMKTAGEDTFVAGNIGDPYTDICDKTTKDSVSILEVSSFMLETAGDFAPEVAAVLNITPDHIDRHGSFENYAACKLSIGDRAGHAVLNYEDPILREYGENIGERAVFFSSKRELKRGVYLKEGHIFVSDVAGITGELTALSDLNILGVHNYENACAAVAICLLMGASFEAVDKGLKSFVAVEHRIEFVREKNGVKYYNDSKGTNPDAAIKAVEAMPGPILLIGGGYDKHSEFNEWIRSFNGRVKHMVILGETKDKIAKAAEEEGFKDYSFTADLKTAVEDLERKAAPGDCILLSPACASWDMFKNFEERGRLFKEYVNRD